MQNRLRQTVLLHGFMKAATFRDGPGTYLQFTTSSLVHTPSAISVDLLRPCRRRLKTHLPPQGPEIRCAFNTTSTPIASAMARLLGDVWYFLEFRILLESSKDNIWGSDFLSENEAVIDYVPGEVFFS